MSTPDVRWIRNLEMATALWRAAVRRRLVLAHVTYLSAGAGHPRRHRHLTTDIDARYEAALRRVRLL
jgi:hypothetical protein